MIFSALVTSDEVQNTTNLSIKDRKNAFLKRTFDPSFADFFGGQKHASNSKNKKDMAISRPFLECSAFFWSNKVQKIVHSIKKVPFSEQSSNPYFQPLLSKNTFFPISWFWKPTEEMDEFWNYSSSQTIVDMANLIAFSDCPVIFTSTQVQKQTSLDQK